MKKLCSIIFLLLIIGVNAQEKKAKKWSVTGKLTFLFNQSSFSNWAAGGDNTIAGNIGINYDFNYKKNGWNWDNKLITSYGLSHITGQGSRKTEDRLEYNSLLGLKTKNYWFFSFFTNFITQYSRGYNYKSKPKKPVSDFFSPAYWGFGPGILWKKSDNARINIAPATARLTFVSKEFSGSYGVKKGKYSNFGLGFNLSSYYKFTVAKNVIMQNILALYSDYLDNPQNIDLDYQINLFVKVNSFMSVNLGLHTISDYNASTRVQFKQIFGLGINYIFHKE